MAIAVSHQELLSLSRRIFTRRGVPEGDANVVSDHLVEANLRGHDSHGVIRIPKWVAGLDRGAINPACNVRTVREIGAGAVLDGDRGLGPVVGVHASNYAISKARGVGICAVCVRGASHIGMLGYYAEMIARRRMIGICMTNTEPGMAPFGGTEKVLGTNPLAVGVPSRKAPLILDMSTSAVARGKIVLAQERGEKIPEGWAIDRDGGITTDPTEALAGALLPLGGAKGSGLAIMVDLLAGALSGAAVGRNVRGTFDMTHGSTKGDLFIAINPTGFTAMEDFLDCVETLRDQVRHCKRAEGVTAILLPGELEYATKHERLERGIVISEGLHQELIALAADRGQCA